MNAKDSCRNLLFKEKSDLPQLYLFFVSTTEYLKQPFAFTKSEFWFEAIE